MKAPGHVIKHFTSGALWLLVSALFTTAAFGQNLDAVKSLKSQLKNADKHKRFEILSAIGFEYRYSFPDSTILYCQQAYELGHEIGLINDLSKPLSFIGLAYMNKGDYQNSLHYHNKAIEVALEQNDTVQLAFGYNNLGRMFFDQGDLVRAFDNLIKSKELFEQLGDKPGLAYVNRSIANVYSTQREFEKALEMSKTAYQLRKEIGEPRMIVSSLMELGLIHQAAGNTQSALVSFLKADSASANVNDPVTRAELSIGLAEVLIEQGNLDEAYQRTKQVLTLIHEKSNQKLFLRATYLQAKYFFMRKDYYQSMQLLFKIMQSAEASGNVLFQRDASLLLSEIYRIKGDNARQNEYSTKHKIFSGMLENTDLSRQIERLQFQVEIEKKERENEKLKSNEAEHVALISKQRLQNLVLILTLAFIGILTAIIWVNGRRRRITNHKLELQNAHIANQREEIARRNEDLSRSNQILSDLNQEKNTLMSIVAHDLKSPLNRISGIASILEMEKGMTDEQQKYIALIKDSTRSGLDLITDLLDVNALEEMKSDPQYAKTSVTALLEEKVKSLQVAADKKSIKLSFHHELRGEIVIDSNYISRIVDNLMTNSIKFCKPGSQVVVTARTENHQLILSVKDDGPGFQSADKQFLFQKFKKLSARPTGGESSNGLGLAIVKTLVDRMNGSIVLNSSPGKGSEFIITLPLGESAL